MELVHVPIALQTNLNELYVSGTSTPCVPAKANGLALMIPVAKSNLYSTQDKTAANIHADRAYQCFENDFRITDAFHNMLDGKWR